VRNRMGATMGHENDGAALFAKPVTDWLSGWDWLNGQWGSDAIDIWNAVRAVTPMAMTERYGRAFMPVTMEAVSAIAKDTENFSSQWVSVAQPDAIRRPAPPITSDPPHHQGHRRLLLPSFSPKKIEPMEVELGEFCGGLIADLDGRDMADAAAEFSQHIAVHGIAQMIGMPDSNAPVFRDWTYRDFQLAPRDNRVREEVSADMRADFLKLLEAREAEPQDDLTRLSLKLRSMENRSIESCSSAICSF
jgi:cytochrome P450